MHREDILYITYHLNKMCNLIHIKLGGPLEPLPCCTVCGTHHMIAEGPTSCPLL